jgi:hypothetical protein
MRVVAALGSVLAEPIRTFVDYKKSLNRKYRPEAAATRPPAGSVNRGRPDQPAVEKTFLCPRGIS